MKRSTVSEAEKTLIDLLDNPSFNRWIKGEANRKEQKNWEKWQAESTLHEEISNKAQLLYSLPFEETRGSDQESELKQLQALIDERNVIYRLPKKSRRHDTWYYGAVAACIVFLISIVTVITIYTQQQPLEVIPEPLYSHIEVGYGERTILNISDGSRIRINSNSSLRYSPEQFNQSQVEVWLEGEAHFSIENNPYGKNRNFIVHTPDGDIRVLGTRFNVNTRFEQTGVVLEEGSIEILLKDSANGVAGNLKLKPGQRAQFSSTQSKVQVQEVDTSLYTAWLDGKLELNETPLKDVIDSIEQIYGISVEIEDSTLSEEKISGSFQNPDLETFFQGLEVSLNVSIEMEREDFYSITRKTVEIGSNI